MPVLSVPRTMSTHTPRYPVSFATGACICAKKTALKQSLHHKQQPGTGRETPAMLTEAAAPSGAKGALPQPTLLCRGVVQV